MGVRGRGRGRVRVREGGFAHVGELVVGQMGHVDVGMLQPGVQHEPG